MAKLVYLLCAMTSLGCVVLLIRAHLKNPTQLLFWSVVCFLGLTLNNVLLFLDFVVYPHVDLSLVRTLVGCLSVAALTFGLVWDTVE